MGTARGGKVRLAAAAIAALALPGLTALGVTTTWTGAAGNNLWGEAGNWDNGVPDANTDAFFGTLTLGGTIDLGGVTRQARTVLAGGGIERHFTLINGTLRTGTVNATSSLEIRSGLTGVGGTLHLTGNALTVGGDLTGPNEIVFQHGFPHRFTGMATHGGATRVLGHLVVHNGTFNNAMPVRVEGGRLELTGPNAVRSNNDLSIQHGIVTFHSNMNVGALELRPGTTRVEVLSSTLTANSLRRPPGVVAEVAAEMWLGGTTLGRIQFVNPPPLVGDGASPTRLPVAPWAYGYNGVEHGLIGRDPSGLRPLNPNTELAATLGNGENVRLVANTTPAPGLTPNSLTLSGATLTLPGDLAIASGALALNMRDPINLTTSLVTGPGSLSLGAEGFIYANRLPGTSGNDHRIDVPINAGVLTVAGDGRVRLTGANTLPGGLSLAGGQVLLTDPQSLGAGPITFGAGELAFTAATPTVNNPLVLAGRGQLRPPRGQSTWTGNISGTGELNVSGGTTRFASPAPATDASTLNFYGTVVIDMTFSHPDSRIFVSGLDDAPSALFGDGRMSGYVQHTHAFVSPGPIGQLPGRLTEGRAAFYSSWLTVHLNGGAAGSGYDQLVVLDSLLLSTNPANDNILEVNLAAGYAPPVGKVFTIIDNRFEGPVDGYFSASNHPEGAIFSPKWGDPNAQFRISYVGGDGNDVTLTVVPEPIALSTAGVGAVILIPRRRRVAARVSPG